MVAGASDSRIHRIRDIADSSEKAQAITREAVVIGQKTCIRVNQLGHAANDINKVTEVMLVCMLNLLIPGCLEQ
jgi:hypothetical protein